MKNEYLPFPSQVKEIIRHTDIEYTFRMSFLGEVRPGQFFEVSIPKFGEAPISVSGIGPDTVDLTIRRVGTVTSQVFEHYQGSTLLMRGPYGNGFRTEDYFDKELFVIAGGTGLSPVKGVVDYFSDHSEKVRSITLIAGFKSPSDILFREDFDRWEKTMRVIRTVDSAPEGHDEICCTGGFEAKDSRGKHLDLPGAENVLRPWEMRPLPDWFCLCLPGRPCVQLRQRQISG